MKSWKFNIKMTLGVQINFLAESNCEMFGIPYYLVYLE